MTCDVSPVVMFKIFSTFVERRCLPTICCPEFRRRGCRRFWFRATWRCFRNIHTIFFPYIWFTYRISDMGHHISHFCNIRRAIITGRKYCGVYCGGTCRRVADNTWESGCSLSLTSETSLRMLSSCVDTVTWSISPKICSCFQFAYFFLQFFPFFSSPYKNRKKMKKLIFFNKSIVHYLNLHVYFGKWYDTTKSGTY